VQPTIADFLPKEGADRLAILRELVKVDMERRRRAGTPAPPDEYLEHYPELAPHLHSTQPPDRPVHGEHVGTLIAGRYKLLEQIGEGGMGTVWVAEQTQPVRRRVALKLIKAGMDSKSVMSRFEAERQALARMGVVYEAVQESLGRHVALKVLPLHRLMGSSLERFEREARAAARPGLTITPGGPDPTVSLGTVGRIGSPSYVTIPVLLDNPHPQGSTGMTEAILALAYDPKVLALSPTDITLGSIPGLGSDWHLVSVVDQTMGHVGIDLYGTAAITAEEGGSLVKIVFHMVSGASPATTTVQLVTAVTVSGEHFATQVDDARGQLVLSPGVNEVTIATAKPLGLLTRGLRPTRPAR
jgi:hypothetical protein